MNRKEKAKILRAGEIKFLFNEALKAKLEIVVNYLVERAADTKNHLFELKEKSKDQIKQEFDSKKHYDFLVQYVEGENQAQWSAIDGLCEMIFNKWGIEL